MTGRPRFVPTDSQRRIVREMRERDHPLEAIAKRVGVSLPTLQKAFAFELKMHDPALKAALATKLAKQALAGNVAALIHLEKKLDILKLPEKISFAEEVFASQPSIPIASRMKGMSGAERRAYRDLHTFKDGRWVMEVRLNLGNSAVTRKIEETERLQRLKLAQAHMPDETTVVAGASPGEADRVP